MSESNEIKVNVQSDAELGALIKQAITANNRVLRAIAGKTKESKQTSGLHKLRE